MMKRSSKEAALKIFGGQKYLFAEEAGAGTKQIISTLPLPNTPIPLLYTGKGFLKWHTATCVAVPIWDMNILNALFFRGHDFLFLSFLVL